MFCLKRHTYIKINLDLLDNIIEDASAGKYIIRVKPTGKTKKEIMPRNNKCDGFVYRIQQ